MGFSVYFRKILFVPEDFCRSIGRLQGVACNTENLICPDIFIETVTDGLCPGIHPDGCVRKHFSVLINGNGGPALTINSHSGNLLRTDIRLLEHLTDSSADGAPPFLRILFCPAFPGIIYRIIAACGCQYLSLPVKNSYFTGTCSYIDSHQI